MRNSSGEFNLFYSKSAKKDLKRLDPSVKKRVGSKIQFYSKKPIQYTKGLTNLPKIGDYRWRVGQYRVAFNLKGRTIFILRIRHRKEIYK